MTLFDWRSTAPPVQECHESLHNYFAARVLVGQLLQDRYADQPFLRLADIVLRMRLDDWSFDEEIELTALDLVGGGLHQWIRNILQHQRLESKGHAP